MPDSTTTEPTAERTTYDTLLVLHAISALTQRPGGSPVEALQLVRTLVARTHLLTADAPLPPDSLRYEGPREQLSGVGALLAEDMEPGSTGLQPQLLALREAGLVDKLYDFVARAERLSSSGGTSRTAPPPTPHPEGPETIHTLLRPAGGWSAIATLTPEFSALSPSLAEAPPDDKQSAEGSPPWSATGETFETEAQLALVQACRLAVTRGRAQPPRITVSFTSPGLHSPSAAQDGVSAAAVALTYLAQETGLPSPARKNVFVMAGITPEGQWTAPEDLHLWETVRASGMAVLSCSAGGWTLEEGGAPRTSAERSLNGAAELLWGSEWDGVQDRWHSESLQEQRWSIVYATPESRDVQGALVWQEDPDEPPLVESSQVASLHGQLLLQPKQGMVLGGPANSGKSVIARQLASRLEGQRWRILAVAPADKQLPLPGDLPAIVRSAMHLTGIVPGVKTLVVIEDLHPLERGDVGRVVSALVGEVGVGVLALTRFSEGSGVEWDSNNVSPMTAVVGQSEVGALAVQMADEHPQVYGGAADALPTLLEAARGDLWLLSRSMREESSKQTGDRSSPQADSPPSDPAGALSQVAPAEAEALRLLAAVSQLGDVVPEDYVSALSPETLNRFGARRSMGLVRIPSRHYARKVLKELTAAPDKDEGNAAAAVLASMSAPLESYLLKLFGDDRPHQLISLLRTCHAYDSILMAELFSKSAVRDAVAQWTQTGQVSAVCTVLTVCDRYLEPNWVPTRLPGILKRVPDAEGLTARTMSSVLRLISRYQHHAQQFEEFEALVQWLGKPGEGLEAVLNRPASVEDRYHLARKVFRLYHAESPALLIRSTDALVRDIRPLVAEDLIHVRKLDVLLSRCHRRMPDRNAQQHRRPLEGCQEIQDVLDHRPPANARFGVVVGWLSLQLHFNGRDIDWDQLIGSYELQVRAALGRATAAEVSLALSDLARNHRGFCTKMLNKVRATEQFRALLREAAPSEAAQLISVLSRIHSVTVRFLLYREADGVIEADASLARALANRVRKLTDGKGAGRLLSTTHRVDELYCHTAQTFAGTLAAHLGEQFALELLDDERRPSVLYYFLRGLWEAEADYRRRVEDSAFHLIVESIGSSYRLHRPWAAPLGLLLVGDDYFGEELLTKLSEALDPLPLAKRMTEPGLKAETFTALHQLARAVHPDIPQRYRARFDMDRLLVSLVPASPDSVAQRLRATATTLRMSGEENAQALLLSRFKQSVPSWDWADEIRKTPTTAALVQALDNLRKLDPVLATSVIHELDRTAEDGQSSYLQDSVMRSVSTPDQLANLLHSVDLIQPGQGRRLLEVLRQFHHAWTTFTEEFQYEQDPSNQGRIGRQLAGLGVLPGQGNLAWMKALVYEKWLKIVSHLASPRAVRDLLKLTYIWDEQWGHEIAASVDPGKLLSRLGLGSAADVKEVPGLLHILTLTGQRDLAHALVDRISTEGHPVLAQRLGLSGSAQFLRRLHALNRGDVDAFGVATSRVLESFLRRHLVVSPEVHWKTIGWAAQALHEVGQEHLLPHVAPSLPVNGAYGAEVSWAAAWLPDSSWKQAALDEALPAFQRSSRTWCQAELTTMALIACARTGRLEDPSVNETYWSLSAEASLGVLALAYRTAQDHEEMHQLLLALKPSVERRLQSRVHSVDPWRQELRSLLNQMRNPAEEARPSLFGPGGLLDRR
ncbi:hypothetical protein ADK61_01935 [Streptomyces sp. XY66]|uniref:hypothetical protein n=1 Tax=Streptomyces sp. XY66 TaxID=1415563 RepID=UPI0006AF82E7|nr:hypothetical protein [Streptomyces sp. XY66]KOU89141.1 hypothetical protein ADK61_01935 [Streptomyces sp. XY66]